MSVAKKIKELEPIADKLPVVIIILNIETIAVEYMSPNGQQILGFSLEEIKKLGPNYQYTFFNPEDLEDYKPKLLELLTSNADDKQVTYFQQIRSSPEHDWSWYLCTSKVFIRNHEGKPVYYVTLASAVDLLHHVTSKVNRLLEENNFLRRNHHVFASLTKRENKYYG